LSCMDGVCPNISGIGRLNAVRAGFVRALDFRVKPFGSYRQAVSAARCR